MDQLTSRQKQMIGAFALGVLTVIVFIALR